MSHCIYTSGSLVRVDVTTIAYVAIEGISTRVLVEGGNFSTIPEASVSLAHLNADFDYSNIRVWVNNVHWNEGAYFNVLLKHFVTECERHEFVD